MYKKRLDVNIENMKKFIICTALALFSSTSALSQNPYLSYCQGIQDKKIPCKTIKIYNNSNQTIYPVIETSTNSIDEWLQAEFKVPMSAKDTL